MYSTADLAVLLDRAEPSRVTEAIRVLLRDGLLLKVRRGLYVDRLNGYRPEIVGQRWLAPSYLSAETALDRHGLCATGIAAYTYVTSRLIPQKKLARRVFESHQFVYRHVARHLFFGYQSEDGALLAEPEKAVLDFLYFTFKNQRAAIAPEDVDFGRLNLSLYHRYLRAYRQRGFKAYALSYVETAEEKVTIEEAIRHARVRAREMKIDPSLTIAEVYEGELLRRLQQKLRAGLVWKGGTVLRLEGSERFSRDLDATRRSAAQTTTYIRTVLRDVGKGLAYLKDVLIKKQPQSVVAVYRFSIEDLLQSLRVIVEVSLLEKVLRPTITISTARIAHLWGLEPVVVARLDPPELLAEKVRALVMRMAGRDIFDVYWLLQRGVEFHPKLFLRKMRYYNRVGAKVDPIKTVEKAILRLEKYDPTRVKTEIANLFPAAQRNLDFGVVVEDVLRALRSWHPILTRGSHRAVELSVPHLPRLSS